MTRFSRVFAVLVCLSIPAHATWDKGWNFRTTAGFVTDGTNETYALDFVDSYPTTRNGVTFGYESGYTPGARDRTTSSPNNPRLSGCHFGLYFGNVAEWRIDLPATGSYTINAAFGDPGGGANNVNSEMKDDTSVFTTIGPTTNASDQYVDASGVNRTSPGTWISSNASISQTFTTTIFRVNLKDPSGLGPLTHIFLSQQASAAATGGAFRGLSIQGGKTNISGGKVFVQ